MTALLTDLDFTSLTPSEVLALATPPPEYTAFLKTFTPPPIPWHDPPTALSTIRSHIARAAQADRPDAEVEEITRHATARDGYAIPLKIRRPPKPPSPAKTPKPPPQAPPLRRRQTSQAPRHSSPPSPAHCAVVVVGPAYRLAPRHRFPASAHDAWDAFFWATRHGSTILGADPEGAGFVVGGVSSGGTHALVIAHLARDRGVEPPVTGLVLSCIGARVRPGTVLPEKYAERHLSRSQAACRDSATTTPAMAELIQASCQNDPESPLFAPLFWPSERGHKGLPRTYFQVCGAEVRRDEVLILRDVMMCHPKEGEGGEGGGGGGGGGEEGKRKGATETKLHLHVGLPHVFWGSLRGLPQTGRWMGDTMEGVGWLLVGRGHEEDKGGGV